ncbi:MAG: hypothetical protein J6Y08_06975 [Clostridiales bacterium]|nr:hypothetical protein [Clostridiales bacterium]
MKRRIPKCISLILVESILFAMSGCDSDESGDGKSKKKSKGEETTTVEETTTASETSETTAPTPTFTPTPTPPALTGNFIAQMKEDGEAMVPFIQAMDKDGLAPLCSSDGNALVDIVIPEGAEELYSVYFQSSAFTVDDARGTEQVGGNVAYNATLVDLTAILTELGEVYTYDQVKDAVASATDAQKYTTTLVTPFVYDEDAGKYLAADTSVIVNEFINQLSQVVIRTYMTQEEVDAVADALFAALQNNDPATFNTLAGGQTMMDWSYRAPLFAAIYQNSEHSAEITTPGVDSCSVTLNLFVHDPAQALQLMSEDPSNFILTFLAKTENWILNEDMNGNLDYTAFGGALGLFLPKAELKQISVPVTISRSPEGQYLVSGNLLDLLIPFEEDVLWRDTFPKDIYLATATYLHETGGAYGKISDSLYTWFYELLTVEYSPVVIEPGPYAAYTRAYVRHPSCNREVPGYAPGAASILFTFILPEGVFEPDTPFSVQLYRDGKYDHTSSNLKVNSDGKSMGFIFNHPTGEKQIVPGDYVYYVYYPGDSGMTMLFATITFTAV